MPHIKQILQPIVSYPNEDFSTFLDRILEESQSEPGALSEEEYQRGIIRMANEEMRLMSFQPIRTDD